MNAGLLASLEINLERQRQLYMDSEVSCCESAAEKVGMLCQAVNDRYRCPDNFFDLVLNERLSSDNGYFRFGPDTICYGRSCSGARRPRPDSSLYDAIRDVRVEDGNLGLPFDPTEIIDNFRLERYADAWNMENSFEKFLRRLYYRLRPLTSLTVRKE